MKNYIGKAKKSKTKFGEMIIVTLDHEKLRQLQPNQYGNIKLCLTELKAPDKFGNQFTIYELESKEWTDHREPVKQTKIIDTEHKDLPF